MAVQPKINDYFRPAAKPPTTPVATPGHTGKADAKPLPANQHGLAGAPNKSAAGAAARAPRAPRADLTARSQRGTPARSQNEQFADVMRQQRDMMMENVSINAEMSNMNSAAEREMAQQKMKNNLAETLSKRIGEAGKFKDLV